MTEHSIERAKERAGLNRSAALNIFEKVLKYGKSSDIMPLKEKMYMLGKSSENVRALLYGEFIYLFDERDKCITMYHTPSWFFRKTTYVGKEHIRNPKKYFNKYSPEYAIS